MLGPKQIERARSGGRWLAMLMFCGLMLVTQTGCWALWLARQIDQCPVGSEGCPCSDSNACVNDLVCVADTCEPPENVPEPVEDEIPRIEAASCQGISIEEWRTRGGTFSGALHDPAAFQEPAQTCTPSWLTSGLAQAYHLDGEGERYAGGPVLAIEFEDGAPVSLNGMSCVPLPNQGYDKIVTSSFCERRYLCGCCGIAIAPNADASDAQNGASVEQYDFLVKAWSAEDLPARQCQGIAKQGRYLLDTPTPFEALPSTEEGVASDSCQECLGACRKDASEDSALVATCCTGAGCVCQDACAITSCPEQSSDCCGQDGHCLCTEDAGAFQCPW